MKNLFYTIFLLTTVISCSTTKNNSSVAANKNIKTTANDTVRIANDELEYEIIIIDPGFNSWLASTAKPRNYYSQSYMESRNQVWVNQWNQNVISNRLPNLFEMRINYDNNINYGYEVNYLLFNYLTFFQITNNIQLGGFTARI